MGRLIDYTRLYAKQRQCSCRLEMLPEAAAMISLLFSPRFIAFSQLLRSPHEYV